MRRPPSVQSEPRAFWSVVLVLCAIAAAASIRRLVALANPSLDAGVPMAAALDAVFVAKAALTQSHVIAGLILAVLIPVQLSARVRGRYPRFHRWIGRVLITLGLFVGSSGYAMVVAPVGGTLEVAAIVTFATAFIVSLVIAWRRIRNGDVAGHREWILRALAIVLGIATTRPVVGIFFATSAATGLTPSQFFGPAFWIGFTSTALAGEWYVRRTTR